MLRAGAIGAATLTLALTGCGGSDKPLTRAELIQKADALCRDYRAKVAKLPDAKTFGGVARAAEDTRTLASAQLDDLKGLKAPDVVAKQWTTYVDSVERRRDALDDIIAAAKKSDRKKVERVADAGREDARTGNQAARDIGLKQCGRSTT